MRFPGQVLLSKRAFMQGWQCPKRLWLHSHPEAERSDAVVSDGRFRKGHEIVSWARELFPGGQSAAVDPFEPELAAERTRQLMESGARVIFDAAFLWNGCFASADVLVRKGAQWHVYDVRSGVSVKENYLIDLAFLYQVLHGAGVPISKCFILHVDNRYERAGDILPEALFRRVPLTRVIKSLQGEVASLTGQYKSLVEANAPCPEQDIGTQCSSPHPCPFMPVCWSHIPYPSIFDIMHLGGERKFTLYYQGIHTQEQLPEGFLLSEAQQMQVEATRSGQGRVQRQAIRTWLEQLTYPLYLLDFECFQPAVPLYPSTRPYQQIPFQFSLHCSAAPGEEAGHTEFLAEAGPDPRPAFVEALLSACGSQGTVLAYNKAFELGRIKELAQDFPPYREALLGIVRRMGDLMEPFEKKWYYAPGMQGSHSIKRVLPALVPGDHYDALEIADGQEASAAFESMFYAEDAAVIAKTRQDLLAYCKLDTHAMVQIMEKLREAAAG